MATRVLIVDDSAFFRRALTRLLEAESDMEVVGVAADGEQGVARAVELRPDVVTMDVEMPRMDGISAVKAIMRRQPTRVLMLSALTVDGAKATMDALAAGATDFFPKRLSEAGRGMGGQERSLVEKIRQISGAHRVRAPSPAPTPAPQPRPERAAPAGRGGASKPGIPAGTRLVVIGASTGGPAALPRVLNTLRASFPAPILLVQHMPALFTQAFAARLDRSLPLAVKEAEDGESLLPGHVYVAPGGRHTLVTGKPGAPRLQLREPRSDDHYRPSVDLAFATAARSLAGDVLGVVLTGMGADGREGARALKEAGSTIWAQDEASSVVYGMPAAVADAGLADSIMSLDEMAKRLGG